MKTHKVIDLTYHEDEGQGCFAGSEQECQDFIKSQGTVIGFEITPLTKEEITNENLK